MPRIWIEMVSKNNVSLKDIVAVDESYVCGKLQMAERREDEQPLMSGCRTEKTPEFGAVQRARKVTAKLSKASGRRGILRFIR